MEDVQQREQARRGMLMPNLLARESKEMKRQEKIKMNFLF